MHVTSESSRDSQKETGKERLRGEEGVGGAATPLGGATYTVEGDTTCCYSIATRISLVWSSSIGREPHRHTTREAGHHVDSIPIRLVPTSETVT